MILLDTNVISALMRESPDPEVIRWLDRQPRSSIWTTSISVFENRFGLQLLPAGKRQSKMMALFERVLIDTIQGRVAPFDSTAAQYAADLAAARQKKGRPRDPRDTMIAGIVLASHAKLATRNIKHFEDIASSVVNPWDQG
ncbi:MAG: type II toxin-antitoxin system VapC family toxin [Terracidiphilus sp.]|jgi:predicted nucleic acid-binding protein